MAEEVKFRCLRCGDEFVASYDKDNPQERSCPKCRSNSVRRIKT